MNESNASKSVRSELATYFAAGEAAAKSFAHVPTKNQVERALLAAFPGINGWNFCAAIGPFSEGVASGCTALGLHVFQVKRPPCMGGFGPNGWVKADICPGCGDPSKGQAVCALCVEEGGNPHDGCLACRRIRRASKALRAA